MRHGSASKTGPAGFQTAKRQCLSAVIVRHVSSAPDIGSNSALDTTWTGRGLSPGAWSATFAIRRDSLLIVSKWRVGSARALQRGLHRVSPTRSRKSHRNDLNKSRRRDAIPSPHVARVTCRTSQTSFRSATTGCCRPLPVGSCLPDFSCSTSSATTQHEPKGEK